jgi:hypothetical protein
MFTADFNRLYYNPNVTYDPPAKRTARQSTILAPDALALYQPQDKANTATWTAVYTDPYLTPATKVDLISAAAGKGLVSVPVFCNTDWPQSSTYPAFSPLEVGNSLGEFSATAGQDCRINGTNYAGRQRRTVDDGRLPIRGTRPSPPTTRSTSSGTISTASSGATRPRRVGPRAPRAAR